MLPEIACLSCPVNLERYPAHGGEFVKVVDYKQSGAMRCRKCHGITPAWRSSGMSGCCPHFYCDTCSNVILRQSDRKLIYSNEASQKLVDKIAQTLPQCSCGGQFVPGSDPKCSLCNEIMANSWDVVRRLSDPNMILIGGVCVFSDEKPPYQVEIQSTQIGWLGLQVRNSWVGRLLARLLVKIGLA